MGSAAWSGPPWMPIARAAVTRPAGALLDQQSQQLGGLAESHVVGQAGPETEIAEEGQPSEPALLVGPQLPAKPSRRRHGPSRRSSAPARRSPSHPSASTGPPAGHGAARGRGRSQHLAGRHVGRRCAPLRPLRRWRRPRSSSRSSTHWPRSRTRGCLRRASWRSSAEAERVVAEDRLPPDVTRPSSPMAPAGPAAFERAGLQPETQARLEDDRHHGGAMTPNPACSRTGAPSRRNARTPAASVTVRQGPGGQRRTERRDEPGGPAEAAEKMLVGVRHVALQGGELGPVAPHGVGGDEQARVVDRLQGELDPPVVHRWSRRGPRRDAPGPRTSVPVPCRSSPRRVVGRGDDAEAGPQRFGLGGRRGVPDTDPFGQCRPARRRRDHVASGRPGRLARRRRLPGRPARGRREPSADRPSAANRRARASVKSHTRERRTSSGRRRPGTPRRSRPGRRHRQPPAMRAGPPQRLDPTTVGPVEQGAPPGPRPVGGRIQSGQHTAPGGQLQRELDALAAKRRSPPRAMSEVSEVGEPEAGRRPRPPTSTGRLGPPTTRGAGPG